jgi:hypothetical protein
MGTAKLVYWEGWTDGRVAGEFAGPPALKLVVNAYGVDLSRSIYLPLL